MPLFAHEYCTPRAPFLFGSEKYHLLFALFTRKDELLLWQTATGPKRKTIYGKTRREVDEKLTKAKADRNIGLTFDADNLKVGEYLQRWLPDSVKDSVKQTTYESYERLARIHLVPALRRIKLKNLTPTQVRGLYREKLDSGLSASSVQRIHAHLHKALKQAVNDGLIPRNVTEAVTGPKQSRKEIQALPLEQARAFLQTAKSDRLETLYLLAIHTGLRQRELLGLKWYDVDLDQGRLQVRRILSAAKSGPTFTTPKNDKGRSVRLTPQAVQALRDHRKRQIEERLSTRGAGRIPTSFSPRRSGLPSTATTSSGALSSRCSSLQVCRTSRSTRCGIASPLLCSPGANTLRWSKRCSDTPG